MFLIFYLAVPIDLYITGFGHCQKKQPVTSLLKSFSLPASSAEGKTIDINRATHLWLRCIEEGTCAALKHWLTLLMWLCTNKKSVYVCNRVLHRFTVVCAAPMSTHLLPRSNTERSALLNFWSISIFLGLLLNPRHAGSWEEIYQTGRFFVFFQCSNPPVGSSSTQLSLSLVSLIKHEREDCDILKKLTNISRLKN